jgi:TPR repeat protein
MEPDQEAAFKYHLDAAEAGHPYAQLAVAIRYFGGLGVERDDKMGVEWMQKASGQGLPRAKHFLGDILTAGLGTEADPEKAVTLYKSAAEDGYGRSQMIYGATLFHQAKSRDDRLDGLKWMMLALPLLREDELARLQVILTGAINQTANDDEIAEAESRARAYREARKIR